jgi:hypothetical protein
MREAYIVLSVAMVSFIAIHVSFVRDSGKRRNLELRLQGYLFLLLFPNVPLIVYNLQEFNRVILVIALILFLVPVLIYPFSPAYQELEKNDGGRSKKPSHTT